MGMTQAFVFCQLTATMPNLFLRNLYLIHYSPVLLIYTPENIRKPKGFLMFSGGIDVLMGYRYTTPGCNVLIKVVFKD